MSTEKIYAGFWVRLFAGLLDLLVLSPVFALVIYFLGFSNYETLQVTSPNYYAGYQGFQLSAQGFAPDYFIYGIGIIYTAYFLCHKTQATLGKRLMGIYVGNLDGTKLSAARATARAGAALVTATTMGLGFLMVIFTKEKIALHDFLCDTRVFHGKKNY